MEMGGGPGRRTPQPGNIGYSNISYTDTGYDYYQITEIQGHLDPFDGDFRNAIAKINDFADKLSKVKTVHDVSILSLPLDVSSDSSLTGNTGSEAKEARFSIRVVLGIKHAA
jgi:hypothetical protein